MLPNLRGNQSPHHYAQLSTLQKPTTGVPYGSTLFETDTYTWFIFTAAGWVSENLGMDANISRLIQVSDHSIAITLAGGHQTDTITIDGVACSFTSVLDTKAEICAGLKAAIAASAAAGKFIVTDTGAALYSIILKPAGILEPVVAVSANLADTVTDGYARINGPAGARLDTIYLDANLNGVMTVADAGVVKAIVPIGDDEQYFFGAKFLTRLEIKLDSVLDFGTVLWRAL
jgi:hypothetical protein